MDLVVADKDMVILLQIEMTDHKELMVCVQLVEAVVEVIMAIPLHI